MRVTVIIPVYNEASTFRTLLERVLAVPLEKEVLIVDDASDEETVEQLVEAIAATPDGDVQLFTHPENQGKGAGIRTALRHATGDVVIIQDADLEYFPEDYVRLLETYQRQDARAVYGVRDLSGRSFLMRYGNNFLTWLTNIFYGARLHDMETCYKMIDRELMQSLNLQSRRFEIEAEISSKLLGRGIQIHEVPIGYEPRAGDEGKKLSPLDGLPAVATLLKYRFNLPEETDIKVIEKALVGLGAGTTLVLAFLFAQSLRRR
jgi:glycosyltransferase involved in cell wall biosynthesis